MAGIAELVEKYRALDFDAFQRARPRSAESVAAYRQVQAERLATMRLNIEAGRKDIERLQGTIGSLDAEIAKERLNGMRYTHNASKEVRLADELAMDLERAGMRLRKKLPKTAKTALGAQDFTTKGLRDAMVHDLLEESARMAKPMQAFLAESIGANDATFAEANFGALYGGANQAVKNIARYGPMAAEEFAGDLSKFVLGQVDATQSRSGYRFRRHVESNGCSWCRDQERVYNDGGSFLRHRNCKCMKVRDR